MQNEGLIKLITNKEVHTTLFQMHLDKVSGPNKMSPEFYQKMCHIVGQDIIQVVKDFLPYESCLWALLIQILFLYQRIRTPSKWVIFDLFRYVTLCMRSYLKSLLTYWKLYYHSIFSTKHNIKIKFEIIKRWSKMRCWVVVEAIC